MAAANSETALQTILDPETGELIEVNLDNAAQPDNTDIKKALKLHDIAGQPVAVLGVKFSIGKTFAHEDETTGEQVPAEYCEFLFANGKDKPATCVSASSEIVASFHRLQARGMASPTHPVLCKFTASTKTSKGRYVHKMEQLTDAEEKALRAALLGK